MDADKTVDLVRIPQQEVLYDRDLVLGRDVNSVFPNQAKEEKKAKLDNISKALGLDKSRFISASELEEIKKTTGQRVENGTVSRDKSLAAILAENKNKKEKEFQQMWKTMKQGKNRPLDEDDMDFVNNLADAEAAKETSIRQAERQELDAFQQAVRKAAEQRQQHSEPAEDPEKPLVPKGTLQKTRDVKPVVKIKQKQIQASQTQHDEATGTTGKRKRDSDESAPDTGEGGLEGLLGDYGSGED